jgi:hypothetical protein
MMPSLCSGNENIRILKKSGVETDFSCRKKVSAAGKREGSRYERSIAIRRKYNVQKHAA